MKSNETGPNCWVCPACNKRNHSEQPDEKGALECGCGFVAEPNQITCVYTQEAVDRITASHTRIAYMLLNAGIVVGFGLGCTFVLFCTVIIKIWG